MAIITPFFFDDEGSRILGDLVNIMNQTIPLFQAFRDEDIDVTDVEKRFFNYKSLMERLNEEYRKP